MSACRRTILFLCLLGFISSSAWANPFLGPAESKTPAPAAVAGGAGPMVATQLAFRDKVAAALSAFRQSEDGESNASAIAALIAGAFVYGLLHAAGPGHRKTIVFSLFLARKARWWEPLAAGFISSLAHAAVGVTLVVVLSLISGAIAPLASMEAVRAWMEGLTFVILALVALLLALRTVYRLSTGHEHDHGQPEETATNGRKLYAIAALASLIPCPGATMLLLFALYLGLPLLGILGVLSMSLGMALVISAAGYLAWFGRSGLFLRLKERKRTVSLVTGFLELGSYLIMLAFTTYAAYPFIVSLSRISG